MVRLSQYYSTLKRPELLKKCKELGMKKYHHKKKMELLLLLSNHNTIITKKQLKFIDLFCGIGGFHQALHKLGHTCVLACDIDKHCRKIYETNYKIKPYDDIRTLDNDAIPDFDILCAGFPCQPFSNAGKKTTFKHKKGLVFDEIIRIAKAKQPKFMFLENVKHIRKISDGKVFQYVLDKVKEAGYYIKDEETVFQLSPHQLGIPQQRERVIFVCIRNDTYNKDNIIDMTIPECTIDFSKILETNDAIKEKYKIKKDIDDVLSAWEEMIQVVETNEKLSPTILAHEFYRKYTDDEFKALAKWKQDYITKNQPIFNKYKPKWDAWYTKHKELLQKREIYGKLEWQVGKKKEHDSIWNYFIQLRQSGIRVKRTRYFPTLVAMVQTPIYAKEHRYITPRECARLQSFPDSFILPDSDQQAYKQFGNAVNVEVVYKVMNETLKAYGF